MEKARVVLVGSREAMIDEVDWPLVMQYHWYADVGVWTTYAKTDDLPNRPRLHQVLMNPPKGMYIDHLDGNGLNCQRSNLEIVTPSINRFRAKIPVGSIPFRGVYVHRDGRYCAQITVNYKKHYLGLFDSPEEAYLAYLAAIERLR